MTTFFILELKHWDRLGILLLINMANAMIL